MLVPALDVLLTKVEVLAEGAKLEPTLVEVCAPCEQGHPFGDEVDRFVSVSVPTSLQSSIAAEELQVLLCPTLIMSDEDQSNL